MYLIELKRNGNLIYNGAFALAAQVYALQHLHLDEPIIFPYISDPEVQVGRYQNILEEADLDYIEANQIILVRRDTGGGTVYIDRHSVNFCFIADATSHNVFQNFDTMYQPVIQILTELGVQDVHKSGRNDLLIGDKKISGAAMTITNNLIYGGFSLLLDASSEEMAKTLRPNRKKMASKGIKSVRSRVTSIREHLAPEYQHLSIEEFSELVLLKLFGVNTKADIKTYELTEADWAGIDHLMATKYGNWEWNFGASPRFSYNRDGRFPVGTVDISLDIVNGRIQQCKIYGDFFGNRSLQLVESALIGVPLHAEALLSALTPINLTEYFGPIQAQALVDLILS